MLYFLFYFLFCFIIVFLNSQIVTNDHRMTHNHNDDAELNPIWVNSFHHDDHDHSNCNLYETQRSIMWFLVTNFFHSSFFNSFAPDSLSLYLLTVSLAIISSSTQSFCIGFALLSLEAVIHWFKQASLSSSFSPSKLFHLNRNQKLIKLIIHFVNVILSNCHINSIGF